MEEKSRALAGGEYTDALLTNKLNGDNADKGDDGLRCVDSWKSVVLLFR